MKVLSSLLLTSATVVGTTVAAALPAAGVPVGACPAAYELRTVVSLQQEAVEAPDSFFMEKDANADGFLCNKYLPEAASFTGFVLDNKQNFKK